MIEQIKAQVKSCGMCSVRYDSDTAAFLDGINAAKLFEEHGMVVGHVNGVWHFFPKVTTCGS